MGKKKGGNSGGEGGERGGGGGGRGRGDGGGRGRGDGGGRGRGDGGGRGRGDEGGGGWRGRGVERGGGWRGRGDEGGRGRGDGGGGRGGRGRGRGVRDDYDNSAQSIDFVQQQPMAQSQQLMAQPQQPMAQPMRPQQPTAQPMRPQQPMAQPMRPQQPTAQPMRPQQPMAQPMRPQQPTAQPMRPQQPTAQPMRPQQPTAQPMRPQQPTGQPTQQQQPRTAGTASSPVGGLAIPLRKRIGPEVGTLGRKIIVETNYLALKFKNMDKSVFHYDVIIKPDKPFRLYRKVMEHYRHIEYPNKFPAFDGKKNLYSVDRLRDSITCFNVFDDERGKEIEYTVEVKYASTVDMSSLNHYMERGTSLSTPMEALQAIDIALRNPSALRLVQVGRSFFTPPQGQVLSLGSGMDLWYGVFQSTVLGWKPYLNIDIAHKGFPESIGCIESLCKILQLDQRSLGPELQRYQIDAYKDYIKGLKVDYEIPNMPNTKRTFKVADLSGMSAIKYRFTHNDREISVAEYFEREKNYRLRYPNLPCVVTGSSRNALPMELCFIKKGQVTQRKLNEEQTRLMVSAAARPAYERKRKILDAMQQVGFKGDRCIKEFGIEVNETFEKVKARILDPPKLTYQQEVTPSQGVWRASRFVKTVALECWGIVNTNYRIGQADLRTLADELSGKCSVLGMSIAKPMFTEEMSPKRGEDISNRLRDFFMRWKDKLQLVVVVIPDSGDTYGKVKKVAEIDVGLLTQCIRGRTIKKINMSTVSNIFLKLNAKLNGVNHHISHSTRPPYLNKPVMIVGADVTHPSPGETSFPSIAAVAASHDPNAFKYNMLWRLQDARVEIIKDMQAIMREQLMFFYRETRFKPAAILFYRDGVSEGQFKTVLNTELTAIRRACSSLNTDYKPTITFLVVQKRHHTRFFPTRAQDEDGRNKNVPAGTIVDTDITHPREFDFYLASHASIQGTSRPTKYHLLWDDANLSEDELEQITYYLCHMFTRCTRSVSYPAPTYYAHLAAFRVRSSYMNGKSINMTNLDHEESLRKIQGLILNKFPMFFV